VSIINDIEIKNFKSLRHQKIEGCKRISVFIGYPNVGKSNILEAISAIQFCKRQQIKEIKNFFRFDDAAEIFFEANTKDSSIISYNKTKSIYLQFVNHLSIDFLGFEYNPQKSANSFTDVSEVSNIINVYKYHFIPKINLDNAISLTHLDSPFGDNLFFVLRDNKELRVSFNDLLKPYNLQLVIDKTTNTLRLNKKMEGDSLFLLSYNLIADTLQRLFFYKAAIQTNKDAVLLFEEPEAHMFQPYISKFTADMIGDENNNQFFITTHSPFVLNDLMENLKEDELAVYIVSYKKDTGETIIDKMNEAEIHEAAQFGYDFFLNMKSFAPAN
jgi:AAA15 family ATPase/GTPase